MQQDFGLAADQAELCTWMWGNNILFSLFFNVFLFHICRYVTTSQSQNTPALRAFYVTKLHLFLFICVLNFSCSW